MITKTVRCGVVEDVGGCIFQRLLQCQRRGDRAQDQRGNSQKPGWEGYLGGNLVLCRERYGWASEGTDGWIQEGRMSGHVSLKPKILFNSPFLFLAEMGKNVKREFHGRYVGFCFPTVGQIKCTGKPA